MKKALIIAGMAAFRASTAPASAAVYNYKTSISNGIGDVNVIIDTAAKTAKFTGANINLLMKDSQLGSFNGNLSKYGTTYTVDSLTGTFSRYGKSYNAFWSSSPKHTQFRLGSNYSFLWMYGRDAWGRVFDFDGKGYSTTYTGSTGGSTGGTPVPAPGMLGLLGLALVGLGFSRRRKVSAVPAMA